MTTVSLKTRGLAVAIDALADTSKEAERATLSAMRAARTKAQGDARRTLVAETGVIQKVWRKRVRAYPKKKRRALAQSKLWIGLKKRPRIHEHKTVEGALRARHPDAFVVVTGGRRDLFRRVGAARLPIETVSLDISGRAERVAREAAASAMKGRYVEVLVRDYNRRLRNMAQRNRNRSS